MRAYACGGMCACVNVGVCACEHACGSLCACVYMLMQVWVYACVCMWRPVCMC